MKKIFLIFLILLININLILYLDSETALICGASDDGQTLIACLGDEELTFLGYFPEEEVGVGGGVLPEPIPPIVLEPILLFGVFDVSFLGLDLLLIYIILIIFICCLFLWLRKRKCDECKKRFKYKDLTKYKGKYYCDKCLMEIEG